MVMTEPENFALTVSATPEEIRNVIVAGLAHDVDPGFHLLPDIADEAFHYGYLWEAGSGNPGGGAATGRGGVPQG
jgi:hypothetical protein